MKKATITTVLQGCKGPQGRTRLAVLIGGVAMLLLLLSISLLLKLHYQLLSAKFLRLLLRVSTTRPQLQERFPALQKL